MSATIIGNTDEIHSYHKGHHQRSQDADEIRNESPASRIELACLSINEGNMNATWIVTANASRARFFSQLHASDPLEEVNDMVNEAVRLRTSETESDRLGPTSATQSIHNTGGALPNKTYEPPMTPTERETEKFARSVADYLLKAYQDKRFTQLSLVVSPQFLGVLRKLLSPQLESAVQLEINKDYTQFSPSQLWDQIRAHDAKQH
jgi:protein required for attachment to host cells